MTVQSSSLPNERVLDFFRKHERFIIVGHKEPDGDCVASQLCLGSFLRRHGKDVCLLSAGPFNRTEIAQFEGEFALAPPDNFKADAVVVVDCSSLSRTGEVGEHITKGLPMAYIDHHAVGEASGEVLYVDPQAPAVAFLILLLIEAWGDSPISPEQDLLMFGICTDTGFFRHLDARSAKIFEAVSRLVAAGASPKTAFSMMYGGKPLASRLIMGRLLSRVESHYDGRLLLSYMTLEDQEEFGLAGRDSDMLYQLLMTVDGMEAVVVVRQESVSDCTVGFRSREKVDVASIAAKFGGGGHRLAAGLHIQGTYSEVRALVISAFSSVFSSDL